MIRFDLLAVSSIRAHTPARGARPTFRGREIFHNVTVIEASGIEFIDQNSGGPGCVTRLSELSATLPSKE